MTEETMISFDSPTTTTGVVPCKLVQANSRGSPSSQPGPESLTSKTLKQRLNGDNEHLISGKRVDESLSREERESTVNRPETQVMDPPRDKINGLKRVFTACKSAIQSKTAPIVNRFVPKVWRLTAHKRQMRKELEMNDIPYKIENRKGKWVPTLVIREVKEELNKISEKEDSPELNEGSVKESEPEIAQVETREDPKQAPNQIDQDHLKPLEGPLAGVFTENEVTGVESQNNETVVEEHSLQCQQKDQIMSESLAAENKIITDPVQHHSVQELADIQLLIENMIACLAADNQISAHSVQQELSDKEVTLKQDMMGSVAADKPTSSTLKPREEEVRHSSIEEQKVSEQNKDYCQHLQQPLAQVLSQKDDLVENKSDHKSMAAQNLTQCSPTERPMAAALTYKEVLIENRLEDNHNTDQKSILKTLDPKVPKKIHQIILDSVPTLTSNGIVLGKYLGGGGYGVVLSAVMNGKTIAVKFSFRSDATKTKRLLQKVTKFNYKFVMKTYALTDKNYKVLAMECGQYDLHHHMASLAKKGQLIAYRCVEVYTKNIIQGMKYLHRNGYSHNDLKPSNILIVRQSNGCAMEEFAKITDFDTIVYCFESDGSLSKWPGMHATPRFGSPEALENQVLSDIRKPDIWSIGLIVYLMLTDHYPFPTVDSKRAETIVKRNKLVRDNYGTMFDTMPNVCDNNEFIQRVITLMRKLMNPDHLTRESLEFITGGDFFTKRKKEERVSAANRTIVHKERSEKNYFMF